jgi:hypothetical protein
VLERWFRHWTRVRHRDAAERTLLTAIASGASSMELAALMLTAVTDRYFADGGHALDFTNKAFESLDIIGWEHAPAILPSVVDQMVGARGSEESNAWRQPIDLVQLCEAAFAELPELLADSRAERGSWRGDEVLAPLLLGDDPAAIVAALKSAIRDGATATDLTARPHKQLYGPRCESKAFRLGHCFTASLTAMLPATADASRRTPMELERPNFAVCSSNPIYLIRFLNVPARLQAGDDKLDELRATTANCAKLFSLRWSPGAVKTAGRIVARHHLRSRRAWSPRCARGASRGRRVHTYQWGLACSGIGNGVRARREATS